VEIQSELPSNITTSLVQYIQSQTINAGTGTIAFDLVVERDRIVSISSDKQSSTLTDSKAIAELEKIILNWRSTSSGTGRIRLVLGL
jgi:hypothetical protein